MALVAESVPEMVTLAVPAVARVGRYVESVGPGSPAAGVGHGGGGDVVAAAVTGGVIGDGDGGRGGHELGKGSGDSEALAALDTEVDAIGESDVGPGIVDFVID